MRDLNRNISKIVKTCRELIDLSEERRENCEQEEEKKGEKDERVKEKSDGLEKCAGMCRSSGDLTGGCLIS